MRQSIYNKGRWQLAILLAETLSQLSMATPLSSDILPCKETGFGSGNITFKDPETIVSDEKHLLVDKKENPEVINGSWRSDQIKGAVSVNDNGHRQLRPTVKIVIHLIKKMPKT